MRLFQSRAGQEAIDRYLALLDRRPELASPRQDLEVVTDPEVLRAHAEATGDDLGVLVESAFGLYVVDLVRSEGRTFPYMRLLSPAPHPDEVAGVVAIGVTDDGIVLVENLRHSTGRVHLELPRGFAGPQEDPIEAGARELLEETGYVGRDGRVLARTRTDSGVSAVRAAFVVLDARAEGTPRPEVAESIVAVHTVPLDQLVELVRTEEIDDGFTVQAIGLLTIDRGGLG